VSEARWPVRCRVVEYETEWATCADDGETVGRTGGNQEEVASPGLEGAGADPLATLAGEIKDELAVRMAVQGDLSFPVPIQL
jgi:hypothetical protein